MKSKKRPEPLVKTSVIISITDNVIERYRKEQSETSQWESRYLMIEGAIESLESMKEWLEIEVAKQYEKWKNEN